MSRITVIGAGYVGLVSAAGFAHLGHSVAVLETNRHRLGRLLESQMPIHEPGLAEAVAVEVAAQRLDFGDNYGAVIPSSDFVFLAVNTPPTPDGSADTSFVLAAVSTLLQFARPGLVIVTKSTVPVGTGDEIQRLVDRSGHADIHVASNPEFLREGSALADFLRPDRVVVGADGPGIARRVAGLYAGIAAPVIVTGRRSAELGKYAANAALATRISFINELAGISESVGADVNDIARIVGSDARIGPHFLQAGLGWGGSCFPKDLAALAATARENGREAPLVRAVIDVNHRQRTRAVELLLRATADVPEARVAVLGLTFKPDTDDLRGSPALDIIGHLLEEGIHVGAHDPQALAQARMLLPNVRFAASPYEAVDGADATLLATEWPEYLRLDWRLVRRVMRGTALIDGRNALDPGGMRDLGFDYRSFGQGSTFPRGADRPSLVSGHALGPAASRKYVERRAVDPVR